MGRRDDHSGDHVAIASDFVREMDTDNELKSTPPTS